MALPNWQRTITNESGDVVAGAEIEVVVESTGLDASLFSDRGGTTAKDNPFFADSTGFAEFYAAPGEYRITATNPATSQTRTWRYEVLIGTSTDNEFTGDNTFTADVTFSGGLPNFTGMVAAFATASAPSGWLACDGAAVSRSTYAALFSAIGTTWGAGDGSTTFNLPDMREVAPVGIGTRGAGAAADVFTLGQFKDDQMQQITGSAATGTANVGLFNPVTDNGALTTSASTNNRAQGDGTNPANRIISFDSANSPNARTGTTTRGKRIGVLYCVKF